MLKLLPSWNDGGDPWGGFHVLRNHLLCVKVPRPKAKKSAFSQQLLFAMTDVPTVTVSTTISTHDLPDKCIEAVQRIFPDFQSDLEFVTEEFPIKRETIKVTDKAVSTDFFLELISEQRILDTALDAMSLNMTCEAQGRETLFTTDFLISRQAALMQKVAFVLDSERTVGGVIEVTMQSPDLPVWMQEATWHPGRREIPRSVGDDLGMHSDGTVAEWFDKKGRATIQTDE